MLRLFKIFSGFLLLAACTAPIELKTNDTEPVIVIYGYLTEGETYQLIRISSSSPYFAEKDNRPVRGALVTIHTSDGEMFDMEEFPDDDRGYYQTKEIMAAVPGVTYRLHVEVDFDNDGRTETYEAVTTMPSPFQPDSLTVESISLMGYKHYTVNLYAQDSPEEDAYLVRYILNDTLVDYRLSNYRIMSDWVFNNRYIDGFPLMFLDDIENKSNMVSEDNGAVFVQQGDKITVCLSRIEKGYAEFIRQCQSEKQGENPFFGGPASNIATNITNGGVGYFTAFSTSLTNVYIP